MLGANKINEKFFLYHYIQKSSLNVNTIYSVCAYYVFSIAHFAHFVKILAYCRFIAAQKLEYPNPINLLINLLALLVKIFSSSKLSPRDRKCLSCRQSRGYVRNYRRRRTACRSAWLRSPFASGSFSLVGRI